MNLIHLSSSLVKLTLFLDIQCIPDVSSLCRSSPYTQGEDGELSFPLFSLLFHPSVLVLCLNKLLWNVFHTSSLPASKASFNNLALARFSFAYVIDLSEVYGCVLVCVCVLTCMHVY